MLDLSKVTPENFIVPAPSVLVIVGHAPTISIGAAQDEFSEHAAEAEEWGELDVINPVDWFGRQVPIRRWILQDWIPVGYTTALYGDGGTGKTLLAQMLMTSCATGRPFLGMAVHACRTLGLFCEDDVDELHRRQDNINDVYRINFTSLQNMRLISGVGANNVLMTFDRRGVGTLTQWYHAIIEEARKFGAELIVIDTAADTFGGSEIDRVQVRQFIGHALNRMAREIGGAVLLLAHPSQSGMNRGDLSGGSTAWNNSVRSRMTLGWVGGDGDDAKQRIFARRKANYAEKDAEMRLHWRNGILQPVERPTGFAAVSADHHAEEVFLVCLDEATAANRTLSDRSRASNYAPKVFADSAKRDGVKKAGFEKAMGRLFSAGKIVMQDYGRPGDPRRKMARAAVPNRTEGEDCE